MHFFEYDIWKSEQETTIKSPQKDVTHTSSIHMMCIIQLFLNEKVCNVHRVKTTSNVCMSDRSYPPGFWAGWTDPPPARPWLLTLLNNSCHSATPILIKKTDFG